MTCFMVKSPKIAVICGHLESFMPLAKYTVYENKAKYCERHGYALHIPRTIMPKYRDSHSHLGAGGFSWSRMHYLLDLIESGQYEWIWTVGADTLITNFTIRLESIIATAETWEEMDTPLPVCKYKDHPLAPGPVIRWNHEYEARTRSVLWPKKHLLACGEHITSVQGDSFIMRSSPESAKYLRDILSHYPQYKNHPWLENQAMIDFRDKYASITHIVPAWMLNSVDSSRWPRPEYKEGKDCYGHRINWQRGDFLIHWTDASLEQRIAWYHKYAPLIVYENSAGVHSRDKEVGRITPGAQVVCGVG